MYDEIIFAYFFLGVTLNLNLFSEIMWLTIGAHLLCGLFLKVHKCEIHLWQLAQVLYEFLFPFFYGVVKDGVSFVILDVYIGALRDEGLAYWELFVFDCLENCGLLFEI